jgi:hypothetical protein
MMRSNNRYRLARAFDREAAATVAAAREQERTLAKAEYDAAAPAREKYQRAQLAAWDALKPGDIFKPGNNVIVIKRKNNWSVTDTQGITWTISEVVGLSRNRAEALRAARPMDGEE